MARLKKLIAAFLRNPAEVAISDVVRLLRAFGFSHRRGKGSHHFFWRGDIQVSIPTTHGKTVKGVYVRRVIALLNLEDKPDGQDEDNSEEGKGP
jgi:predicted RNA binding protein YcfA (HicA-like mRNA interferase family)